MKEEKYNLSFIDNSPTLYSIYSHLLQQQQQQQREFVVPSFLISVIIYLVFEQYSLFFPGKFFQNGIIMIIIKFRGPSCLIFQPPPIKIKFVGLGVEKAYPPCRGEGVRIPSPGPLSLLPPKNSAIAA